LKNRNSEIENRNWNDPSHIVETERRVLRALCQGTPQGAVRATARDVLQAYRWREPVHQVVFDVVLNIPTDLAELVRSQLPARLTRRGFPDVDIDDFFKPHQLSKGEAERLMRELRDQRSEVYTERRRS